MYNEGALVRSALWELVHAGVLIPRLLLPQSEVLFYPVLTKLPKSCLFGAKRQKKVDCLFAEIKSPFPQNYAYQKHIRKHSYLKVKIHARIGLSPPAVKFGHVLPDLSGFVETVPKFDRKTLKMVTAFSSMYNCTTVESHSIL